MPRMHWPVRSFRAPAGDRPPVQADQGSSRFTGRCDPKAREMPASAGNLRANLKYGSEPPFRCPRETRLVIFRVLEGGFYMRFLGFGEDRRARGQSCKAFSSAARSVS